MRFAKPIKWIADIAMLLLFLAGLNTLWILGQAGQIVPNDPSDLGAVQITVKDLDFKSHKGLAVISAEEYPTKFLVSLPENNRSLVKIGQKVDVEIKKEKAENLDGILSIVAYGLTLNDGTVVMDRSKTLFNRGKDVPLNVVNASLYYPIVIALIYFLVRFCFPIHRYFSKRNQSA